MSDNDPILRGMDGTLTVQRESSSATFYGDRHLDGNEADTDLAKLHPFARDRRGLTGQECTCVMGTYARGSKPPLTCRDCGGFLPRGLTEESYRRMRVMKGIAEPQAPGLSEEMLNQIATQVAERITEQMAERFAQMATRTNQLLEAVNAKLAGQEPTKTDEAGT